MTLSRSNSTNAYRILSYLDSIMSYILKKSLRPIFFAKYRHIPTCRLEYEDWDNLIILDACRYDQFARLNTISGEVSTRISLGSSTPEFLHKNFQGAAFHDTVYVTANPMYRLQEIDSMFHDIIDVWESQWDNARKTVLPIDMVNEVKQANEEFPNKRIMAHFMQPHYPFIGEYAEEIGDHAGFEWSYRKAKGEPDASHDHPTVWDLLQADRVDKDTVWQAYDENLEIVLEHMEELIPALTGKTVITSDHGNLVGEKLTPLGPRMYGHPKGVYSIYLRKVPWLEIAWDHRKHVTTEEPKSSNHARTSKVEERLSDLGYVLD